MSDLAKALEREFEDVGVPPVEARRRAEKIASGIPHIGVRPSISAKGAVTATAEVLKLYDNDIVAWAKQQGDALRRRAANEIDWDNVAEEIDAVGRSEVRAVLSQIDNILRHRIYLRGWPDSLSVRSWEGELAEFERQLHYHYRPSMTTGGEAQVTDSFVHEAYAAALRYCRAHMDTGPTVPLPEACPWPLSNILTREAAPPRGRDDDH